MIRFFYSILWVFVIYIGIFIGHYTPSWLSTSENTIDFFCWGDTIEAEQIEEFEKAHGIRVRIHPFSSNEEMIVKLKAMNGKGYDLVCASDYAVRILKEEGLLAPLDHKLIPNEVAISTHLLHQNFDPENEVSLPVEWESYVFVKKDAAELEISDLFKDLGNKRIVMTSDPVEAIMYAAYSLYGQINSLTDSQLLEVKKLLKAQKKSIEAYADHRAKYLIETDNCDLALIRSGFARLMEQDEIPIHYSLPKDWHFLNIENVAMVASSTKKVEVHKLINFMLSYNCQKFHTEKTLVFPARNDLNIDSKIIQKIHEKNDPQFFKYLSKEEDTRDLWVSLKGHNPK
ncbi:MAG: ABC transporter substrate-binding protein [Chlamydiia bacterium]